MAFTRLDAFSNDLGNTYGVLSLDVTISDGSDRGLLLLLGRFYWANVVPNIVLDGETIAPLVTYTTGADAMQYRASYYWVPDALLPAPGAYTVTFTNDGNSFAWAAYLEGAAQADPASVIEPGPLPITIDLGGGEHDLRVFAGRHWNSEWFVDDPDATQVSALRDEKAWYSTSGQSVIQTTGAPGNLDAIFFGVRVAPSGAAPPTRRRSPLLLLPY